MFVFNGNLSAISHCSQAVQLQNSHFSSHFPVAPFFLPVRLHCSGHWSFFSCRMSKAGQSVPCFHQKTQEIQSKVFWSTVVTTPSSFIFSQSFKNPRTFLNTMAQPSSAEPHCRSVYCCLPTLTPLFLTLSSSLFSITPKTLNKSRHNHLASSCTVTFSCFDLFF